MIRMIPAFIASLVALSLMCGAQTTELAKSRNAGVEFYTWSNGIFGLPPDVEPHRGLIYPRGSGVGYIYAAGLWFGAESMVNGAPQSGVFQAYSPGDATSWGQPGEALPGAVPDGPAIATSLDFDRATGRPTSGTGPGWPLWLPRGLPATFLRTGRFLPRDAERSSVNRLQSPAFVGGADEQMVLRFSDTATEFYPTTYPKLRAAGMPYRLQMEEHLYGWSSGALANTVLLQYDIVNAGTDTLRRCFVGQATDPDVGAPENDRMAASLSDSSLATSLVWTDPESDVRYGVLAITVIETPTVGADGRIDNRGRIDPSRQIGLTRQRQLVDQDQARSLADWYSVLTTPGPSFTQRTDVKCLHASGPFTMAPGDTAHFAIAYAILGVQMPLDSADAATIASGVRTLRTTYYAPGLPASEEMPLTILPNPTSSSALLQGAISGIDHAEVSIIDPIGRLVLPSRRVEAPSGVIAEEIDVPALPAGCYFVRVASTAGVRTLRLVVVR